MNRRKKLVMHSYFSNRAESVNGYVHVDEIGVNYMLLHHALKHGLFRAEWNIVSVFCMVFYKHKIYRKGPETSTNVIDCRTFATIN